MLENQLFMCFLLNKHLQIFRLKITIMFRNIKKINLLIEACEALIYQDIRKSKMEDIESIIDDLIVQKTKILYRSTDDKKLSQQAFYNLSQILVDLIEIVVKEGNELEETEIIDEFIHEIYPYLEKYYSIYLDKKDCQE